MYIYEEKPLQKFNKFFLQGDVIASEFSIKSCASPGDCIQGSVNLGDFRTVTVSQCCDTDLCNNQSAPGRVLILIYHLLRQSLGTQKLNIIELFAIVFMYGNRAFGCVWQSPRATLPMVSNATTAAAWHATRLWAAWAMRTAASTPHVTAAYIYFMSLMCLPCRGSSQTLALILFYSVSDRRGRCNPHEGLRLQAAVLTSRRRSRQNGHWRQVFLLRGRPLQQPRRSFSRTPLATLWEYSRCSI